MSDDAIIVTLKQRPWQRPLVSYFRERRDAGKQAKASVVAHRRAGKDRVALFIELEEMLERPCEVWHCLPEYAQARKVIWDARTKEGARLIHTAFPPEIVKPRAGGRAYHDDEMKVELLGGSLWRLVGADNFNALMGANPRHVTFSEFALTSPRAREFVRPILAENGGSELTITTPRGYNHAYDHHEHLKGVKGAYTALHPVSQTKLIDAATLAEERRDMPDELYRQEYECEFSAANVGAILGSRVEQAEKEGRIKPQDLYDTGQPVILSSDIGFRDACSWWFWQPRPDGFALIDFDEESGLDAPEWVERLAAKGYSYGDIWLPHDAQAKTFATRRSAQEVFMAAKIGRVHITPRVSIPHRVNAARLIMALCRFDSRTCKLGLSHLRQWAYKWDDDRRTFSKDPEHDEHSHGGDAFSYGALVMQKLVRPEAPAPLPKVAAQSFTLDRLYEDQDNRRDLYG